MACKDIGCCLDCHFSFEEKYIIPHLPPAIARRILADHARLKAAGYPRKRVLAHAEAEMPYFRRYAPAGLVAQIEKDHRGFASMGWVPANGPKSGPPGPLVTGYVYGIGEGPARRGLGSPIVLAVLAGAAFLLWHSDKPKRRRR